MHKLEYILLVTSVAVEKGKIGKSKLAKVLFKQPAPHTVIKPYKAFTKLTPLTRSWMNCTRTWPNVLIT